MRQDGRMLVGGGGSVAGLEDFVLEAKTWREPVHVRIEPRARTHTHTHVHTLQLQRDV